MRRRLWSCRQYVSEIVNEQRLKRMRAAGKRVRGKRTGSSETRVRVRLLSQGLFFRPLFVVPGMRRFQVAQGFVVAAAGCTKTTSTG